MKKIMLSFILSLIFVSPGFAADLNLNGEEIKNTYSLNLGLDIEAKQCLIEKGISWIPGILTVSPTNLFMHEEGDFDKLIEGLSICYEIDLTGAAPQDRGMNFKIYNFIYKK